MMMREERAKQFAPFDAMKGLQEALRDREERHARTERREFSEETREKLSETLSTLHKGMRVRVICYRAFHETELTGTVLAVDSSRHELRLDTATVSFMDLYGVKVLEW